MVTPFRMTQDIHVAADTSKNCVNYPTSKFKSYTHCDEEFVYNMFQNEIGLMPFWVAKSMDEVTQLKYVTFKSVHMSIIFLF